MWSGERRPDPDELLAQITIAEKERSRGKLRVFLGYAAGVGKTYSMLEAAHQRQAEGVDIVVGYIETHGRQETEKLLTGLEIIPRRKVEYRGTVLTEMDLDAILRRHPSLVLVDELAHTNAPGSRHPKRYEDVEELLAAGIDVYTTLNIQHLESLRDAVAQVTGITVGETVPDRVLDKANDIELIDLPPAELLRRLSEGKVYIPEQAGRAMKRFFRPGNLSALRQMALRRAAERVDVQMRDYMRTRAISGPWPAGERLLVCVSPSPLSERLIRAARRWADRLNAEWHAVYVELPGHSQLSETARRQLIRNLQLAEELGARVVTLPGQKVADTVVNYARNQNVTKIIAGKPLRPRLSDLLHGSVAEDIIRQSGPIDVNIISGTADPGASERVVANGQRLHHYVYAVALVIITNLLTWPIHAHLEPTNLVMLYLASVIVAATYLGLLPSALVSVLSVLTFDYFWVEPRFTFAVKDTQYVLTFLGLLGVGLVVSGLSASARAQLFAARDRERQTATLFSLSRSLTSAASLDEIVDIVRRRIAQLFSCGVIVLLPEGGGTLQVHPRSGSSGLDDNEMAVATWAFQHGVPAGFGTETLPAARGRYLPLKTAHGVVGVVGVEMAKSVSGLTPGERQLLEALANLAAVAIERARLAREANQLRLVRAKEEFQVTLLNSISHDLRTPLASIMGILSTLRAAAESNPAVKLDDSSRQALVETAWEQAERLNRLFANLLDMTRLEANALKLKREPCEIEDAIGAALAEMSARLGERPVRVDIQPGLPMIPFDFVLIVQVLVNLIDNAVKYSPREAPIDISAKMLGDDKLEISVADRGIGIPSTDLPRIFDKFYRVQRADGAQGTGLGLAICKGIVEAHGGQIAAENRPAGGTVVSIRLPAKAK